MQISGDWWIVFIKPDGEVFAPAAMFPERSLAVHWLAINYQGEHDIQKVPVDLKTQEPKSIPEITDEDRA